MYSTPEYVSSYDCVVACFFIDCAHNIIQFVQTINRILKQGGTWLNLGPLLYHFSDMKGEDSIEPDYHNLKAIIQDLGFEFEFEEPEPDQYAAATTASGSVGGVGVGDGEVFRRHFEVLLNACFCVHNSGLYIEKVKM